jgi:hypothetical protein
MAWKSDQSGGGQKRGGWSGGSKSRDVPQHRWQDAKSGGASTKPRSRQRQSRWIVASLLAVGLLSTLVYLLLVNPVMTPVVVIAATNYAPPVPPNPWAVEDGVAISALHEQNISFHDASAAWNEEGPQGLDQLLPADLLAGEPENQEPIIVYISAHGIVNDAHQACLLRPGASAYDPTSWITVGDLLAKIDSIVPKDRAKLVILDCNRIRMNWSLGVLYNSFVERVKEAVGKLSSQNFAVLTSAGEGQTNWASADLGGSVFGRYVQLGLAGAADESSGDGVGLHELAAYLAREVDAWSRFNRGEPQQPLLLPKDVADFRLTWVASGGVRDELENEFRSHDAPEPAVSPDKIGSLWTKLAELRERELVRYDPIACRDLEHELLHLESLAYGGDAYANIAKRQYDLLNDKLTKAVDRGNKADDSRAVADHSGILTPAKWAQVPSAVYTLPVSEYFGSHNSEESKQVETLWKSLMETSDQQDTSAIIERSGAKSIAADLAETQFLTALRDQHVAALWRRRPVKLSEVLQQRTIAEQLAVPRRSDGSPGDERAHYHARRVANEADAARRLAEDVLFVGENNAPEHYEVAAKRAAKLYELAQEVMDRATAAFKTHDAALAETPYLAAWICSPLTVQGADDVLEREDSMQIIGRLVRNTRQLGEVINQHEKLSDQDAVPGRDFQLTRELARQLAGEVQNDLDEVRRLLQDQFNRLIGGRAQGTPGWRAIEAVLQVPLIPGETRADLLTNRSEVSASLCRQYFESGAREEPPAGDQASGGYLDALAAWNSHPFVDIMRSAGLAEEAASMDAGSTNRLTWCETSAAQLRSRLAELPAGGSAASGVRETPAEDGVAHERARLSLTERQLRAAAAVDFDSSEAAANPIVELRRFDLQQLLIWHARRTIEDFWGGVANTSGEESFFARAADKYLQAAAGLGGDLPLAVRDQLDGMRRLLSERIDAKRTPLEITAAARPLIEPAGSIEISLAVKPNSTDVQYPQGMAALHVRGGKQRLADLAFARSTADGKTFVDLPPARDKPQQLAVTIPGTALPSSMMQAVSYFRGREDVSREFPVPILKGVVIDYEPHRYEQQKITLLGDRLQQSSIVFILDCSYSMIAQTRVEGGPNARNTMERMELARSALNTMLRELADRNDDGEGIRVGVRFMGHRLVWTRHENPPPGWKPTLKVQTGYSGEKPRNDETPAHDVEVVHHLGEFDDTVAGQVRRKLDSVKAWGQTPLFYALSEALADFDDEDRETRKSIIAITDGKDYQYDPPTADGRAPEYTSQAMLLDAWSRRKIPIHILAFDIPKDEIVVARTEYANVAEVTDGSFAEVTSGRDLLNRLRERLDIDGYIVKDSQQQPVNPVRNREVVPSKLNFPVPILADRRLPQEFSVHFRMVQPKRVLLEGGEAIELQVVQRGASQEIVARPYDRSVAADSRLVNGVGGSQTNHIVRVHRPVRRDGSVRFPVSLQVDPAANHFTKRPVETWVEVTPLAGGTTAGETYVFYDRNLEPETPVPVLMWTAQNWPQQADEARVKCWYKYDATDPVQTIAWRDVVNAPSSYRAAQSVPGVPGVQISVEASVESDGNYRIYIVERHSTQSLGIDSIRVHLETGPDIVPIRVSHQFDAKNGIATHSYFFSPDQRDLLDRSELCKIEIAAADDVKGNALQLAEGTELKVQIDDTGELFSPRATASGQ